MPSASYNRSRQARDDATARTPDDWLTPAQVTEQYKISRATLTRWRSASTSTTTTTPTATATTTTGPAFRRLGRAVHYRRADVESFICAAMLPR
jgi:hypothetical protein